MYELIWHCINDTIQSLIEHIECSWYTCWRSDLFLLIIIDFVNNHIYLLLIYWLKDSLECLWSTNPLQARCSLSLFCLANRCIISGFVSLTIFSWAAVCGRVSPWLGFYPLAFPCLDCLRDVSLGLALLNRKSPPSRWQWVGKLLLRRFLPLTQAILTFPTNRAITGSAPYIPDSFVNFAPSKFPTNVWHGRES